MELAALHAEFVKQIEAEYEQLYIELDGTFDQRLSSSERMQHSVKLAELSGVDDSKIIRNRSQLDALFSKKQR